MITKQMLKEGPKYRTSYETVPGEATQQSFYSKEENDSFASGMELMGVVSITKSYLDPLTRKWLPYTDAIFYTENI